MNKLSDAEIARQQGVSRAAIGDRRAQGWSEKEILQGFRDAPRKSTYRTNITKSLGMSVREAASMEGVTVAEIYRRVSAVQDGSMETVFKKTGGRTETPGDVSADKE